MCVSVGTGDTIWLVLLSDDKVMLLSPYHPLQALSVNICFHDNRGVNQKVEKSSFRYCQVYFTCIQTS